MLAALYGAELRIWPERLDYPDATASCSKGTRARALCPGAHFGSANADEALTLRKWAVRPGHPHVAGIALGREQHGSLGRLRVASACRGTEVKKSTGRAMPAATASLGRRVWEGAMFAAHIASTICCHHRYNKLQSPRRNAKIMGLGAGREIAPSAARGRNTRADGRHRPRLRGGIAGRRQAHGDHCAPGEGKGVIHGRRPAWHGSVKRAPEAEDALKARGGDAKDFTRWLESATSSPRDSIYGDRCEAFGEHSPVSRAYPNLSCGFPNRGRYGRASFQQEHSRRFLQFGIDERKMAAAGGLAAVGDAPVVTTFACCSCLRDFEQAALHATQRTCEDRREPSGLDVGTAAGSAQALEDCRVRAITA